MSDEFLVAVPIPPPVEGIFEGLDPALDDSLYPPTRAQDLRNIRVASGKWQTRAGSGAAYAFGMKGSGATRLFDTVYEADGSRFRILVRGDDTAGVMYDLEDGVDSAWQAVSGGTGLGTTTANIPYHDGEQVGTGYYYTDRLNALKKYATSGTLAAVTIPAAPSVMPGAKARTYATLEAWTGGGTMGWTESDSGNFDIADGSGDVSPPMGSGVGKITISGTGARGDTLTKDVANQELASHSIAFFYWTEASRQKHLSFGIGLEKADEFTEPIFHTVKQEWIPIYIPIGNLPVIQRKRIKCIRAFTSQTFYLSEMYLPGRLEGLYRWRYTHYNPTTGHESGLSPISNSGEPMDFSAVGVTRSDGQAATKAFQKSCMLTFTSDSGTDAATTKIRIYRSGGVPELTVDPATGRSIWLRVGEVLDLSNQLNGGHLAADTTLDVDSGTGFAADQWIVIAKGTSTEEYQKIASVASNTLTVTPGLLNNQSDNATVQVAFLDNVGNEAIDVVSDIQEERDTAPAGAHWVAKAPDGRIWLFRYTNAPTGVSVSNRPTPLRPDDHECFADDVDPFTRADPSQGWTFGLGAEATGDEIIWGGFFRGLAHTFTRNKCFRINAHAQTDWGANAVQKVLDVGCIGGHTVCQIDGYLYWVAEGPRVVRWDGDGPVEVLSHQRVNERLNEAMQTAGTMNSTFWFAVGWEGSQGKYLSLFYNYSDVLLGCLSRVDYNLAQDAWEPVQHLESNGDAVAWNAARSWDRGSDLNELVATSYRGRLDELEIESAETDSGVPITFLAKTKRAPLGMVAQCHEVYVRLAAVTDELTLTVRMGGSDYADTSGTYTIDTSGSGDLELRIPVERTVKGRWIELTLSGSVSNRPAVREMVAYVKPIRERKSAADA